MQIICCECNEDKKKCSRSVEISNEQKDSYQKRGLTLIVDGCPNGPSADSTLVETCDGYKLYRPQRMQIDPIDLELLD